MLTCTIQSENQNIMSFLEVQLICEDKTCTTSVHCKPSFSGVYTHFDSFLPSTYKFGNVSHSLIEACKVAQVGINFTMN